MNCPICKSKEISKIHTNFIGYVEGTHYNIFGCVKCNTQFVSAKNSNKKIYDFIYSEKNISGYFRYYNYAKEIKNKKDSLKFLSKKEPSYYPVYQFLKKIKKKLKILDVGCGYGYLTYTLNSRGHLATGIDISKNAISYAKSHFGGNFHLGSLDNYKHKEKFDLIVAIELFEHLHNPLKFISLCIKLLKKNGKIIITTPNRDYFSKDTIWKTDLPPIHTLWLSKKSFKSLSKHYNLKCDFVDFSSYISNEENKLISYLLSRYRKKILLPFLDKKGKPFTKKLKKMNFTFKKIIRKILLTGTIKYFSHFFIRLITSESETLGVIFTKKKGNQKRTKVSFLAKRRGR